MPKSTTISDVQKAIADALESIFIVSWEKITDEFKDSLELHWKGYDEFELWDTSRLTTLKTFTLEYAIDLAVNDTLADQDPDLQYESLIDLANELDKSSKKVRAEAKKLKPNA